jgi:hypothetical protein
VAAALAWPKKPAIAYFRAEPASVALGQPVRLSWSVKNAKEVYIPKLGDQPSEGSVTVLPKQSESWVLQARNGSQQVSEYARVEVVPGRRPPPGPVTAGVRILRFDVVPAVAKPNEPATLYWQVEGASDVTIGNSRVSPSGQATVRAAQNTQYTLIARSSSGESRTATTTLSISQGNVTPPAAPVEILGFDIDPPVVRQGQTAQVRWNVRGAQRITIDPGGWKAPALQGSEPITPRQTMTLRLTAQGQGGATATSTATVTVMAAEQPPAQGPRILTFTATPQNLAPGQHAQIRYQVAGATRLVIEPEVGTLTSTAGIVTVFPQQSTRYRLTAIAPNGEQAQSYLDVYVRSSAPPQPARALAWQVLHHHADWNVNLGGYQNRSQNQAPTGCQGTLIVANGRLRYEANDGFDVPASDIRELNENRRGGYVAVHVKLSSGKNYNFIPMVREPASVIAGRIKEALGI